MASPMTTTQPVGPLARGSTIQTRPSPVLRLSLPSGTLRLRAEPSEQRHIQWAEDVIDNEGMGKKSSKVCCIYHKPRAVDESSDESSSDSSSDSESDSEPDNSTARPLGAGRRGRAQGRNPHNHSHRHHDHDHDHDHDGDRPARSQPKRSQAKSRKRSPNAYEKMPKKR